MIRKLNEYKEHILSDVAAIVTSVDPRISNDVLVMEIDCVKKNTTLHQRNR